MNTPAPSADRPLPPVDAHTQKNLDFPRVQGAVAARAQTDWGRTHATDLPLLPSVEAVRQRLGVVGQLMKVAVEDMSWPSLSGVSDVEQVLRHARREGVLEPLQLMAVARTFSTGEAASNWCLSRKDRAPLLAAMVDAFGDYAELVRDLTRSFEPSGRISDEASPQLRDLRRKANSQRDTLKERMERLVREFDAQGLLQDTFHTLREDRYVLPVKANERWRVEGIVHDTSQTHQTFFIEPQEVVDLGNRLKMALADVQQEEMRILRFLSERVGQRAQEMSVDLTALHALDVVVASARLGVDLGCHVPQLSAPDGDGPRTLHLRAFRHPVLTLDALARQQKPNVVANELRVGSPAVLVITGPNTGGKTVALKGVGLSALMVRAGLPVPASADSHLPIYDRIHAVLGDGQSIQEGLSSFGAHLQAVRQMLTGVMRAAEDGHSVLCVLDEVMSGTDPDQGAALAQAVLEDLAARGAHVAATTHFEKLKALPLDPQLARTFRNASVGLAQDSLTPTYRLVYDQPGSSSALQMAARLGLPGLIVERARSLTSVQGRNLDELVSALTSRQAALDDERAALAAAHEAVKASEKALADKLEEVREEQRELKKKARTGLLEELQRSRRVVQDALDEARGAVQKKDVEGARAALARAQAEEEAVAAQVEADRRAELRGKTFSGPLTVGMRVHVLTLGVDGEVVEVGQKDALVAAGVMRVRVAFKDLVPPLRKGEPRPQPVARVTRADGEEETVARTLDVRGQRVEDALEALAAFVDRAAVHAVPEITVIHGHGTGVLRGAVRDALKAHPVVVAHGKGPDSQGGNGITVITLRNR